MRFSLIKRSIKFWWQRKVRGWDDSETWSLDHSLAKLILPRLKRFKEVTVCYPMGLTEVEWNEKLDKMIAAFEFHASDDKWNNMEKTKDHEEGIRLFAEHFNSLWW